MVGNLLDGFPVLACRAEPAIHFQCPPLERAIWKPRCGDCPESANAATSAPPSSSPPPTLAPQPTSFASGRYEVKRFLGEGGKKRVYLAHDAQLDRDVAFALIKTEGLDEQARQRINREAQAMGRLSSHPHFVTV